MLRKPRLRKLAEWLARRSRLERARWYRMKKMGSQGYLLGQAEGTAWTYRAVFRMALRELKEARRR